MRRFNIIDRSKERFPIITDSFTIPNEGTFRFVKYCTVTYWSNTDQQGVEQLLEGKWIKLSYEESSRIAKLYLKEFAQSMIAPTRCAGKDYNV